eukprot:1159097-Pelagomonas_calceolata.AAC.13
MHVQEEVVQDDLRQQGLGATHVKAETCKSANVGDPTITRTCRFQLVIADHEPVTHSDAIEIVMVTHHSDATTNCDSASGERIRWTVGWSTDMGSTRARTEARKPLTAAGGSSQHPAWLGLGHDDLEVFCEGGGRHVSGKHMHLRAAGSLTIFVAWRSS